MVWYCVCSTQPPEPIVTVHWDEQTQYHTMAESSLFLMSHTHTHTHTLPDFTHTHTLPDFTHTPCLTSLQKGWQGGFSHLHRPGAQALRNRFFQPSALTEADLRLSPSVKGQGSPGSATILEFLSLTPPLLLLNDRGRGSGARPSRILWEDQ